MSARIPKMNVRSWLILGLTLWVTAVASAIASAPPSQRAAAPQKAAVTAKVVPGAGSEGQSYVGEAKCLECHSEQLKGYEGSPHHRVADPRAPASKQGCESCHGPGS